LDFVVAPRSIVRGIHKLPAAHALVATANGGTPRPYWRLPPFGTRFISEPDALEQLDDHLARAVRRRLVADVPLGVLLSGGIDSSLVAASAARERSGIQSFSVKSDDPSFDESRHARTVADHLGTTHVEGTLAIPDALAIVERLPDILDEPIGDASN